MKHQTLFFLFSSKDKSKNQALFFLFSSKDKSKNNKSVVCCNFAWRFRGYDISITPDTKYTIQILCIGTDRSQQTVQTKIRLLLKKQSDQDLRCLPFHQHLLDALMQCYIKLFDF